MSLICQSKTIGQLSRELSVPEWKLRRVTDSLGVPIPRAGLYRIVPPEIEERVCAELRWIGWLPAGTAESRSVQTAGQ